MDDDMARVSNRGAVFSGRRLERTNLVRLDLSRELLDLKHSSIVLNRASDVVGRLGELSLGFCLDTFANPIARHVERSKVGFLGSRQDLLLGAQEDAEPCAFSRPKNHL